MLGVLSELDAESAVSHLSLNIHLLFAVWLLYQSQSLEPEPEVIHFSFYFLTFLSITASDKDTGETIRVSR